MQATGRDVRGRLQYRYHAQWRAQRDQHKFHRLADFAAKLPDVRAAVERDLATPGLTRRKLLAAMVSLLDRTFIRVGDERYRRDNGSFGLTTLRTRHVRVSGDRIRLRFRGKSGKEHDVSLADRRLARIVRRCLDLPGYELFQYVEDGEPRKVCATDVNAYLQEISGADYTAKDFRTWGATVIATVLLTRLRPRVVTDRRHEDGQPGTARGGARARQHAGRMPQELRPSGCRRRLPRRRVAAAATAQPRRGAARRRTAERSRCSGHCAHRRNVGARAVARVAVRHLARSLARHPERRNPRVLGNRRGGRERIGDQSSPMRSTLGFARVLRMQRDPQQRCVARAP